MYTQLPLRLSRAYPGLNHLSYIPSLPSLYKIHGYHVTSQEGVWAYFIDEGPS